MNQSTTQTQATIVIKTFNHNITPANLKAFQLDHYTKRLNEEQRPEAKRFIRQELFNLKK